MVSRTTSTFQKAIWTFFAALLGVLLVVAPASVAQAAPVSLNPEENERVASFIEMAAGKQIGESADSLKITQRDLRFIGVFLSNYYTPFVTELGVAAKPEAKEEMIEVMVEALMSQLAFEEETATVLVNTVLSQIANGSQDLSWKFSSSECLQCDTQGTSSGVDSAPSVLLPQTDIGSSSSEVYSVTDTPNIRSFIDAATGVWFEEGTHYSLGDPVLRNASKIPSSATSVQERIASGRAPYAHLVYDGNSVFTVDTTVQNPTSGQVALEMALGWDSSNIANTFALNNYDLREDEIGEEEFTNLKDLNQRLNGKLSELSIPQNGQLKITPFGDIIHVGPNHQVVLIPAALNPYTWQATNADGTDLKVTAPPLQGVSLFSMASVKESKGLSVAPPSGTSATKGTFTYQYAEVAEELYLASGGIKYKNVTPFSSIYGYSWSPVFVRDHNGVGPGPSGWGFFKGADTFKEEALADIASNPSETIRNTFQNLSSSDDKHAHDRELTSIFFPGEVLKAEGRSKTAATKYIPIAQTAKGSIFTNILVADTLGIHEGSSKEKLNSQSAYTSTGLIGELSTGDAIQPFFKQKVTAGSDNVSAPYESMTQQDITSLYLTYAFASLYSDSKKAETIGALGFRINDTILPEIQPHPIDLSFLGDVAADKQTEAIRNWTYYLLHPTDGLRYVSTLISNKVSSFLVSTHTDMVGTDGVGILPGTTKYTGFSGYVTTPSLSDISWLDALVNKYYDILVYIIIAVTALMGLYAITSVLTIQQAVAGAVLFAICAWIPAMAINVVVDISNNVSSKLYSSKFSYWSLLQHQTYTSLIDKAATEESYESYLQGLYEANNSLASDSPTPGKNKNNMGGNSIVVKWQAPKKMSSLNLGREMEGQDAYLDSSFVGNNVEAALRRTFSGETYTGNPEDVYFFRSYVDLGSWSRFIYQAYQDSSGLTYNNLDGGYSSKFSQQLQSNLKGMQEDADMALSLGVQTPLTAPQLKNSTSINAFLGSGIYADAYQTQKGKVAEAGQDDLIGIDQRYFTFDMSDFTQSSKGGDNYFCEVVDESNAATDGFKACDGGYSSADIANLAAYGLYSESPFFYFSWQLYDQGLSPKSGASDGFKDLILRGTNGQYFFNNPEDPEAASLEDSSILTNQNLIDDELANGGMKDFLNYRYMFKYVIPYLQMGNEIVKEYSDIYGLRINKGVSLKEDQWDRYKDDPVLLQQYWHNLNVARLYNMYSPWVDLMYGASYADSQAVDFQGERIVIENPLDPSSYPEDRPMVFSEAEMEAYGLQPHQLTTVESKIQQAQKGTQKRFLNLLNYYNYDDAVLNTAASMEATFQFNQTFSESGLFDSIQLYPQSFELNNFTYDSFLRLILANSTGYDITANPQTDYYTDIVQQSSMVTGVLLIANDFVAIYLIPGVKLFFIVGVFLSSIIMLFASAVRVTENVLKNTFSALIKPLLGFLAVSIGFAWLISLFMSSGNVGVTGEATETIKLGDPALTLTVLLVINIVVLILYAKILGGILKNLKKYTVASFQSVVGVGAGVGALVSGVLSGKSREGAVSEQTIGGSSAAAGALGGAAAAGAASAVRAKREMQQSFSSTFTPADRHRAQTASRVSARNARQGTQEGSSNAVKDAAAIINGKINAGIGKTKQKVSRGYWGSSQYSRGQETQQRARENRDGRKGARAAARSVSEGHWETRKDSEGKDKQVWVKGRSLSALERMQAEQSARSERASSRAEAAEEKATARAERLKARGRKRYQEPQ